MLSKLDASKDFVGRLRCDFSTNLISMMMKKINNNKKNTNKLNARKKIDNHIAVDTEIDIVIDGALVQNVANGNQRKIG